VNDGPAALAGDDLAKLLYCASVFVQTEDQPLKGLAQSIALNTLMTQQEPDLQERCQGILNELGNFPGLRRVEEYFGKGSTSLLDLINRRVSRAMNTVDFGSERLALTDFQKDVWDRLPDTKSLAVSAPTSAGKSFLVIEHLCRLAEARSAFIAVYIAPTRALLAEVHQKMQARLTPDKGVRLATIPTLDPENRTRQVFVLTQERLQVLLAISNLQFDVVVVDEAQNLSEGARGMILHDCLEAVVRRNPGAQVIMLAPGAKGLPEVAKTFGVGDVLSASTSLSPVLQNRIVVSKVKGLDELELTLLGPQADRIPVGRVKSSRGLTNTKTRLAAVALELGGEDGSLVYATGPDDADTTATQLMNGRDASDEPGLRDLSGFIREHIHPEYRLATMVQHGVGFHYGRMPHLLREALETSFKSKDGGLRYLVCTTTLFQGINLPARNVFIDTPYRGRASTLDAALLWNFAGRAGRLSQDVVGNVYLVDYDEWGSTPMDSAAPFNVSSAIADTLKSLTPDVVQALAGNMPKDLPWLEAPKRIRACAGLLIAKAARSEVHTFLERILAEQDIGLIPQLAEAATAATGKINLPPEILEVNWTIDPYGLRRLYDRLLAKIETGEIDDLIPLNPHESGIDAYAGIFIRILREVYGTTNNFGGLVASLAIPWMEGKPYPVILAKWIATARRREARQAEELAKAIASGDTKKRRVKKPATVDKLIRDAFDLIETVVRFQFVQLGKAYLDLLRLALAKTGNEERVSEMFDFALALEMGISTRSGTAFVELGLSRIAASVLENLFPDSNFNMTAAREALARLDPAASNLSPVIVDELTRLRLLQTSVL
jgi:hypothetical protein